MCFSGGNEATLKAAGSPFPSGAENPWNLCELAASAHKELNFPELILSSPSFIICTIGFGITFRKSLGIQQLKVFFSASLLFLAGDLFTCYDVSGVKVEAFVCAKQEL